MLTQVFLHDFVHSLKQPEFPHLLQRWVSLSVKQSLHSLPDEREPKRRETVRENACACFVVKTLSVWFTASFYPEIPPEERAWLVFVPVPFNMCVNMPSDRHACHFTFRVTLHISVACMGFLQQVPSPTSTQYVPSNLHYSQCFLSESFVLFCFLFVLIDYCFNNQKQVKSMFWKREPFRIYVSSGCVDSANSFYAWEVKPWTLLWNR